MNYKPTFLVLILAAFPSFSWAIPVEVVADANEPFRIAKVVEQIKHAKNMVDKARRTISTLNEIKRIAGDPKSVINSMKDLGSATSQLDQIFKTQSTRDIRNLVSGSESLRRSGDRFHDTVGESFLAGKEQIPRRASLYETFHLFEQSQDSFENLVDMDGRIQESEAKRQTALINDLVNASTQAEVDKITAAISASKGVQETSSRAVAKRYYEIEMQERAIRTAEKKAELAELEEKYHHIKEAQKRIDEREKLYGEQFNRRIKAKQYVPKRFEII